MRSSLGQRFCIRRSVNNAGPIRRALRPRELRIRPLTVACILLPRRGVSNQRPKYAPARSQSQNAGPPEPRIRRFLGHGRIKLGKPPGAARSP